MEAQDSKSNITVLSAQSEEQRQAVALADTPRLVSVSQRSGTTSEQDTPQLLLNIS